MSRIEHVPVLLAPVLEGLNIKPGGLYVDATFGRGGHSGEILKRLGAAGRLVAIDRDPQAVSSAPEWMLDDARFELIRGDFGQIKDVAESRDVVGSVDGLLLDLGVSSPQLDQAERGFSFMRDGPLDMRMDPESGMSAARWLASIDEKSLANTLKNLGEEPHARRIAQAIVLARRNGPIERTAQLAHIVATAAPAYGQKIHPATRTFQAIRIAVNAELEQLKQVLAQSTALLNHGGRLCVLSFHSLEDRIVKRFMRDASQVAQPYRGMPSVPEEFAANFRQVGRAGKASASEIAANPRSRSARLRVAEKI